MKYINNLEYNILMMIEHTKTFYENVIDSVRFAVSDKVSIIVIGVTLTLISTMQYYEFKFSGIGIIINVILIMLMLFEAGYSSKIIDETIGGSTEPPIIENILEIIKLGVKEFLVIFGYSMIIAVINTVFYAVYDNYPSFDTVLLVINIILSAAVLILMESALIYRAYKSGSVREGYDLKGIFRLYSRLGLKSCIFLFLASIIAQIVLVSCIFDLTSLEIVHIIKFILKFTLAPISLIFSLRLFALQGKIE